MESCGRAAEGDGGGVLVSWGWFMLFFEKGGGLRERRKRGGGKGKGAKDYPDGLYSMCVEMLNSLHENSGHQIPLKSWPSNASWRSKAIPW